MLNAIDGIVVDVEGLERRWTLRQHKGRDDHDGAVAGLRVSNGADFLAFADLVGEVRGIARPCSVEAALMAGRSSVPR
jgi:hypothetical protein